MGADEAKDAENAEIQTLKETLEGFLPSEGVYKTPNLPFLTQSGPLRILSC